MAEIKPVYYSYNELLSKQRNVNMVVGARSIGKTYGAIKDVCLKRYFAKGEKFFYLRRRDQQIKDIETAPEKFLGKVMRQYYPNYSYDIKSRKIYIWEDGSKEKELIGYIGALSTFYKIKSQDFLDVKNIIFDEFIAENGEAYVQKEVYKLLNIIQTVVRSDDFRLIMMANSIQLNNPYFEEFGVYPDLTREFTLTEHYLIHYPRDQAMRAYNESTPFNKVFGNTEYAKMSLDNEFRDNTSNLIEEKSDKAVNLLNLIVDDMWFGAWFDLFNDKIYFSYKHNKSVKETYVVDAQDADVDKSSIRQLMRSKYMQNIIDVATLNNIRFDSTRTRTYVLPVLQKMNIL